jgi:hypothetical protein
VQTTFDSMMPSIPNCATDGCGWLAGSPTHRSASPAMAVRRNRHYVRLRRLREPRDKRTWPQACPMIYGAFPAKCLMPLIYAKIYRRGENRRKFVPQDRRRSRKCTRFGSDENSVFRRRLP